MKPPLRRSSRQSGEGVRPHTMAVPSASTLRSSTKRRGDVHTDASLAATNESLKSSRNRKRKRRDDLDDGETEVDSNPSPDLQAVHKQYHRRQEPLPTSEDTSLEDNYFAVESPDEVQSGSNPIGPDLTKLPPLQPLPSSSADLLVPHDAVLDCLAVYTFLRSFSRALFLSPFSLQEFQRAVCSDTPTTLMDSVHVSLLQAVRRHLERLAQEGSGVARGCLRQPDWKFLDTVTWSSHLKGFLVTYGFKKSCDAPFPCLDVEYYKTAVKTKLAILNFLCDHILETAEIRIELDMRQRADGYKIAQESEDSLEAVEERALPGLHGPAKDSLQVENCNVEAKDTNIDECVLCGMDGNLICCDGCPASYHSRCVGVSKGALPRGDWFCPECRISRSESKFVGLKGADLLGVDPYGHTFMATSGYLLVAESHVRSSVGFTYYNCRDLSILLEWMEKMDPFYHSIKEAVQQHWNPVKGNNSTKMHNDLGSDMLIGEDTIEVLNRKLEIRDYKTGFGPKGRADGKIVKGGLGFCDMCRHDIAEDDELRADGYINHYIQGDVAATAAASVALLRSRQDFSATKNGSLSKKIHVNEQLNAFYKAQPLFYWPNMKKKLMELPKERCGWCFSCKNPIMKRGCLLNQASGVLAAGAAHIPGGVFPTKSGSGHLPAVAGYLLHMEENLKSLLLGCWEDANYRTWWQKQVREAACVSDLKIPLLQLESCLRPVILSEKWFSCEEDDPPLTFGSSTAEAALLQSIGYKRKQHSLSIELRSSLYDIAAMTWLQRWKRGKHSKKVFHWYILPMQVARQAGRQGGLKKIQGLFYTEGLEVPKRSRHYAWQAMVEAACTVSQVALQVRCLDACIRWDELLSSTQFNGCEDHVFPEKAMIYAKKLDGGVPMFLVDAEGDSGPFNQHESNISKSAMNKDQSYKVWLSEPELPLSILKDFEQRTLILRQENLAGVAVSQKCYRKPLKASKKDVFDKLLLRSGLCCREDVLSSSELHKLKERGRRFGGMLCFLG